MRYLYGGGIADWALRTLTVAEVPDVVQAVGGAVITCWASEAGSDPSDQYTDLVTLTGDPVAELATSMGEDGRARGVIPPFRGPDGVRLMWLSADGGPRQLVEGVDESAGDGTSTSSLSVTGDAVVGGDMQVAGSLTVSGPIDLDDSRYTRFSRTVVVAPAVTGLWPVWRAARTCRVTGVHAIRSGGTGATVAAVVNGTPVLGVNLSVPLADVWTSDAPASPVAVVEGDSVQVQVVSLAGTPTVVTIQLDFEVG
ncbi:hypothetical protein ABT336_13275 [Micromonospora sp. NPDC000207]|uniref:hypothetical protein n=1 Tax=Micromonospora sp. NPDC000207 TaxID=3154246 RepID=UPI003324FB94